MYKASKVQGYAKHTYSGYQTITSSNAKYLYPLSSVNYKVIQKTCF